MDSETPKIILSQSEQDSVDFKRELKFYDADGNRNNRVRDELIKDILAMANGNANIVGDTKYLIIGAADDNEFPEGEPRPLYDMSEEKLPTKSDIQKMVNAACFPAVTGIQTEFIEVEGKQLYVISILPSPSLHETNRKLDTPKKSYSEHLVFTRRDEDVSIASAKDRETIVRLKQLHFAESKKVSPMILGAIIGPVLAIVFWDAGRAATVDTSLTAMRYSSYLVIGAFGVLAGVFLGWVYHKYLETRNELMGQSRKFVVVTIALSIVFGVFLWAILYWIFGLLA